MEGISDFIQFMAGWPATAGLILAAATIFVTSDARLALAALLGQYVLLGLALTRFVPAEVAIVRIIVGVLVVPILYLTAQHVREVRGFQQVEEEGPRFLGMPMGWGAGPLGLPLRLLTVLLAGLAVARFFPNYPDLLPPAWGNNPGVPANIAFVAFWLAIMGLLGIVLSGEALRTGPAVLTVLAGFDLIYAGQEANLAIAGFLGALTLLVALAFSYLAAVEGLGTEEGGTGT